MHRRKIGRNALAGSLARRTAGGVKSALRFRGGLLNTPARVILIVIVLMIGQLPIRAVKGAFPTTSQPSSEVPQMPLNLPDLEHFLVEPAPRQSIVIETVESEFQKKERLAAEERNRQLVEASKRRAPVRRSVSGFYAGQCTAFVAAHFPVTWRGNAKDWGRNAALQGYRVDKKPEAGAAVQLAENSGGGKCSKSGAGCGHVAYIDAVIDGQMYISEQNYEGWGVVSKRVLPVNSPLIASVIHRK